MVDLSPYQDLETWMRNVHGLIPNYDRANGRGVEKVLHFHYEQMGGGRETHLGHSADV